MGLNRRTADLAGYAGRIAVTLAVALVGGFVFWQIGIPVPFMLGAMMACWLTGALVVPLRPTLRIPNELRILFGAILGALLGTGFSPETVDHAASWWPTVLVLVVVTAAIMLGATWYLTRVRAYDPLTAIFCSAPGGFSEVLLLASMNKRNEQVVAIFHLMRVATVFLITPFLLWVTEDAGHAAIAAPRISLLDAAPADVALFAAIAGGGYLLGRLARVPSASLFGPLFLSVILHSAGWIALPRYDELVILAQVVIGSAIGCRMAAAPFSTLRRPFVDATVVALVMVAIAAAVSVVVALTMGDSIVKMFLLFVPGGIHEVAVMALAFGFEVAMVSVHHTLRILLIFVSLPFVLRFFSRRTTPQPASSRGSS